MRKSITILSNCVNYFWLDAQYVNSDNDEIEELMNSDNDDEEQSSDDFRRRIDFGK